MDNIENNIMSEEQWIRIQALLLEGRVDDEMICDMVNEINELRLFVKKQGRYK